MSRWIIFDADNTLWQVEPLYNAARKSMTSLVAGLSGASPEEIKRFQRRLDVQMFAVFGYSPNRFESSFVETAPSFLSGRDFDAQANVSRDLARMALKLRTHRPSLRERGLLRLATDDPRAHTR